MRYKYRYHPSKLVTVMAVFGAGSRVEFGSKYPIGIAHFMEHMRFKGNDNYDAKDLIKMAADVGASWNAWTSEDAVAYHITAPEENIEEALKCLSEVVRYPTFPQAEMEKEQEVVCQEVRMYDDEIDHLVHQRLMQMVFSNSLQNSICGTEESVRSITRKNLLDFNSEFYSPEHMLILLSAPSNHGSLVEKYFGQPDDIWLHRPFDKSIDYAATAQDRVIKKEQLQNVVSICYGNQEIRDKAFADKHVFSVMNHIFGSGEANRLYMHVREDLGLVYGVGSYLNHGKEGTLFEIYTHTEPTNVDKVFEAIQDQVELLVSAPPSEKEMQQARNGIRSRIYGRSDTSQGALSEILDQELMGGKIGSEYLALIDSVTPEQVHELAKLIFSGTKYTVIGSGE